MPAESHVEVEKVESGIDLAGQHISLRIWFVPLDKPQVLDEAITQGMNIFVHLQTNDIFSYRFLKTLLASRKVDNIDFGGLLLTSKVNVDLFSDTGYLI